MNQELEDLIKALDTVLESRDQSKVIAERGYREKFEEAVYKTYRRWVRASQHQPTI